jgi:TusA-related sulfurtransferase
MNITLPNKNLPEADYFIDISDEICPMTFVKTKLLIERMALGETARVRLQGKEPLDNVPRSIKDYGHTIISLEREEHHAGADGIHVLIFRKDA